MNYGLDILDNPYVMDYAGSAAAIMVVSTIIAIAALVCAVLCYIWFLHGKQPSKRNTKLGRFFNFDHYYLDKILKVIYLVAAIGIAAVAINGAIMGLALGLGGFFAALIFSAIGFVVAELVLRVTYEYLLIFVQLAIDVRKIRKKVSSATSLGEELQELSGGNEPKPQPAAPGANANEWDCPACGWHMTAGEFCIKCGAHR